MKPLHVALVVKNSPASFKRADRQMGFWSYPVPEFTWEHVILGKDFATKRERLGHQGYELIFVEDGGNWGTFKGHWPPVVYLAIDSTLSERHYEDRYAQAMQADLVLVEHDRLERFLGTCRPVRRFNYCVNDRLFQPGAGRDVDVAFHCSISTPGSSIRRSVLDACRGWAESRKRSIRWGPLGLEDYALSLGTARVVVNWPRVPGNRPHRIFDAMASGAAVVSGPFPRTEDDGLTNGETHLVATDPNALPDVLDEAFGTKLLRARLQTLGLGAILGHHTWAVRARELREMLAVEFPRLAEAA